MIDSDIIASLPKVELHDHLDGGVRPATLVELAEKIGYELPTCLLYTSDAADEGGIV